MFAWLYLWITSAELLIQVEPASSKLRPNTTWNNNRLELLKMSEKDYVLILWSSCIMAPLDRNMYSTPWGNTRLANMSIPEGRTSFIRHPKKKKNVFSLDANSLAICQSNQRQSCVTLSRWSCHSFQRDPPLDIILGAALRKQRCASFQRLSGHSKPKTATVWACCFR